VRRTLACSYRDLSVWPGIPLHPLNQLDLLLHPIGILGVWTFAVDEPLTGLDFLADQFGQTRVIVLQSLEVEQQRIVPALLEFVADFTDFVQVTDRKFD
jgi:hypothetical protein